MRSFSLVSLLLLVTLPLTAQDIRESWNLRFPIPGITENVYALAVEGEDIAVLTPEGVRIYRDGLWSPTLELPANAWSLIDPDSWWPVRNLALYQGEPWIAGDTAIYRHTAGGWRQVERPVMERSPESAAELAVVNGELYLVPNLHRWTGSGWEGMLPECVAVVHEAVASKSGRWFLVGSFEPGCGAEYLAILDNGVIEPIAEPDVFESTLGIAFDGENPVTLGYRYSNGVWEEHAYPEDWDGRMIYPIAGAETLYAIAPGWPTSRILSFESDNDAPCSNRLYRLDRNEWVPVSGFFDPPVHAIAMRGEEAILGGHFTSDDANILADRVVGYDGSDWIIFDDDIDRVFTGVDGTVNDVELQGDSIWVAGGGLYSTGFSGTSSLLLFTDGRWYQVPGITGVITRAEVHAGDLYVVGNLTVDGKSEVDLARLRDGSWSAVSEVSHHVVQLTSHDSALYVGVVDRSGQSDPVSHLYRITDNVPEVVFEGWAGEMNVFAPAGDEIWIGSDDGRLAKYSGSSLRNVTGVRGETFIELSVSYRYPPSIHSLLWYDGWLYVGGSFDSVAGMAVGTIARFNGERWESLDSGMSRRGGYWSNRSCEQFVFDRVSSLHVVDGEILAAGAFERISTISPRPGMLTGGERVAVPLAIYNLGTQRWRAATPPDSLWIEEHPEVRDVDIDGGRIAIAGDFTLAGKPDSRNLAVTDRILSAPTHRDHGQPADLPFRLVHRNGRLFLETEKAGRLAIELYDISGRLLAILSDGRIGAGEREILLPDGTGGTVLVVVRDEEGRSVGEMVRGG